MTAAELIAQAAKRLSDAGVPEPELDAKILFLEAFHMDQVHFLMNRMRPLTEEQRAQQETYEVMIDRRSARVPLQQILGSQEFMGLTFRVTPDVLIPRQDTETLVEQVLHEQKDPDIRLLDLCTGSGCIGLSIAVCGNPKAVTLSDVSEEAIATAGQNERNLDKNGWKGRGRKPEITYALGNLWEPIDGKFDLIVSNPPYIETEELSGLMPEVIDHEPILALDGGKSGLVFYEKILEKAPFYLEEAGILMVEIGYNQGEQVKQLFEKNGFADVEIKKDLAGLDRVVRGRLSKKGK